MATTLPHGMGGGPGGFCFAQPVYRHTQQASSAGLRPAQSMDGVQFASVFLASGDNYQGTSSESSTPDGALDASVHPASHYQEASSDSSSLPGEAALGCATLLPRRLHWEVSHADLLRTVRNLALVHWVNTDSPSLSGRSANALHTPHKQDMRMRRVSTR